MFDKFKQLYDLKKQADSLKKELEREIIEVESGGFKGRINGNVKFTEISLPDNPDAKKLRDFVNKAVEEAQKIGAKRMQGMLGGLGDLQELLKK